MKKINLYQVDFKLEARFYVVFTACCFLVSCNCDNKEHLFPNDIKMLSDLEAVTLTKSSFIVANHKFENSSVSSLLDDTLIFGKEGIILKNNEHSGSWDNTSILLLGKTQYYISYLTPKTINIESYYTNCNDTTVYREFLELKKIVQDSMQTHHIKTVFD